MPNIQNQSNGIRRTMLVCLVISILSIGVVLAQKPTTSEQQAQQPPGPVGTAVKPVKFCEGKYRNKDGSEVILSIQCTSPDDDCECLKSALACGKFPNRKKKEKPSQSEFVEGSCKITIIPDK